ncbi:MAG: hypothetical protein HND53_12510 [Proteobacteria bacterium]|nr:hypothetical protein [Pseudomonadota bacterium]NOG61317.1 hypothetical protein [Pseudomonadota bacterium]
MNLIKTLLIVSFLILSQSALAESWYQVEVIVFDRLYPKLDGEQWQNEEFKMRDNMVELEPDSVQGLVPYMVLNKSRNRLGGVYRVLKLSSEYRPLYHVSWQQEATERRESRYVHIQKLEGNAVMPVADTTESTEEPAFIEEFNIPDRIIDGSIRIRSGFYLHADIDLSYFKQLPPENKVLRSSEESYSGFDKTVIKLKETRKIKLNEIHYFDHPMFGVILQVSRLTN